MNQKTRGLRIACGIVILLNFIILFVPMTRCSEEGFSPILYSQFDYIVNVTSGAEPYFADYTTERFFWMFFFIVAPCILSMVAGIWGIVVSEKKNYSWILVILTFVLYVILLITIGGYLPDNSFSRDMAVIWNIIITAIAGILAMIALFIKEEKPEEIKIGEIPDVNEIKQEQITVKYNIITDESKPSETSINPFEGYTEASVNPFSSQTEAAVTQSVGQTEEVLTGEVEAAVNRKAAMIPQYVQSPPRGVLVGLTGMYAGAEIPFVNGMSIRLGRLNNNDLIFDGQVMVSRNHCTIRWDGVSHTFIFKDTSSSGTYVNGSDDCLPQNIEIEIPVGSVIALGDDSNTFRLE